MTASPKESANIVSLKIKNFLSISDVEIKPGSVNQIVGANNQGKTTILKAIEFAVNGSNTGSVVKMGEDSAEVIVELSDQTTIRRRINSSGKQTVDVKRDGFAAPSPQAYLGALFDQASFNPLELLDPKKRADAILKSIDIKIDSPTLAVSLGMNESDLPPIDYDQHGLKVLEQAHKFFFQRRAEANKDVVEKKKRWETYKSDFVAVPAPEMTQVVLNETRAALSDKVSAAKGDLHKINLAIEMQKAACSKVTKYETLLGRLTDELKNLDSEFEKRKSELNARIQAGEEAVFNARADVPVIDKGSDKEARERIETTTQALMQLDLIEKDIRAYDSNQKQALQIESLEKELETAQLFSKALTERVEVLAGDLKNEFMSKAEMPVKGLQYVDGAFLVEGVSIDNLSSSAALRLAIGVARKLAKKTKIISIDGAEALDEQTWNELRSEMEGDGFTYFVTRVGEAFEGGGEVFKMEKGSVLQ